MPSFHEKLASSLRHIIITGASGAGKSTLAEQLAERLNLPLKSTDQHPIYLARREADPKKWSEGKVPAAKVQAEAARDLLLNATEPGVFEGTGFASLGKKLLAPHELHLVDPPKEEVLKRRLQRWLDRQRLKGLEPSEEELLDKNALGNRLYDKIHKHLDRIRNMPGVIKHSAEKISVSKADFFDKIPRGLRDLMAFFNPGVYKCEKHNCFQGARKIRDALEDKGIKSEIYWIIKKHLKGHHFMVRTPSDKVLDYGVARGRAEEGKLKFLRRPDGFKPTGTSIKISSMKYHEKLALALDIEVGDTLLGGRFKNVPTVVEDIGEDELGQPTVNGKKLLAFRIKKKMPEKTASKECILKLATALGKSNA